MKTQIIYAFFFLFLILTTFQLGYSESVDSIQLVAKLDIAELMMQKYQLTADQRDFTIFHRISTLESVGEGNTEDFDAKVVAMEINQERTSLVITLENIKQTDLMSVRFPQELISAEKGKFTLLVDGEERGYEWSVQEESRNLIFIIPKQTTEVEIIGNRVIPEFTSGLLVLIIVSSTLLITQRLYKKLV